MIFFLVILCGILPQNFCSLVLMRSAFLSFCMEALSVGSFFSLHRAPSSVAFLKCSKTQQLAFSDFLGLSPSPTSIFTCCFPFLCCYASPAHHSSCCPGRESWMMRLANSQRLGFSPSSSDLTTVPLC